MTPQEHDLHYRTPEAAVAKKQTLDDMRDEAHRRQDNLASDIDELINRVNPKNAAMRWKNETVAALKGFSAAGDDSSSGAPTAAIVGGVIGVVVLGAGVAAAALLAGGRGTSSDGTAGKSVSSKRSARKGKGDRASAKR